MIAALILGRKGSTAFPGKNTFSVMGRMMSEYTILGAKNSKLVDKVYISTDDEKLMELGEKMGIEVISRPDYLSTKEALGEDAFVHGYHEIVKRNPNDKIEMVVLLFCNAPTYTAQMVDDGINALRNNPKLDSAVSVSQMNWYSPVRARKINKETGLMEPYIPFDCYPDNMNLTINCDRNTQIACFFADCSLSVVRPENLINIHSGELPQKWMGKNIFPIHNVGGLDIDEAWQLPLIEGWLRSHGFNEERTPYDNR